MLLLVPLVALSASAATEADRWRAPLERVTRAVVSIRMDRPKAFEGSGRSNSIATGFVIDAEQGLILTNRHVVTEAPVIAKAVFLNHEEVDLLPVYRDPVHDFGVFRYEPDDVRFIDVPSLVLSPESARVGVPIRVVGNDAGEQISILDSTLARLDRPAPSYGSDFSDFNTFYIQAASSTSGGSSGSPVVDIRGRVVGLNAGGKTRAASSFYLPLDRVVRAVELIRKGAPVTRGTLQVRFEYEPYDELGRLGLSEATEAAARKRDPDGSGLLVVRDVLPGGPAHGKLQAGDVLLELAGTAIHDFVTLEGLLDERVGESLPLVLERAGERVEVTATVGDLHAIVPSRYLEFGGAVLHDLSYHQARVMQVPVEGVYVADNGYALERAGLPWKSVLTEADGVPLAHVGDLVEHLSGVAHGAPVTFRWYRQGRPELERQTTVRMDRVWFPAQSCTRDDASGAWPCTPLPEAPAWSPPPPPEAPPLATSDKRARALASSLVVIENDVPYQVAGLPQDNYVGGGLVVDAERGWVLVDRDTVPISVGELSMVVAGTVRVPARLVLQHPTHNLALVAYDPATVDGLGLASAELAPGPEPGDKVWSIALDRDFSLDVREVDVRGTDPVNLGIGGAPRFRETNLEVLDTDPSPSRNGVLVDRRARVVGFHASFSYNAGRDVKAFMRSVPAELVQELLDFAQSPEPLGLAWELDIVRLPQALEQGLPAATAERLIAHDPERRDVLAVERIVRGSGLVDQVRAGDLVVAIDGEPVTRFRHVDDAVRGKESVRVTLVRGGEPFELALPTEGHARVDVDRVVLWAGMRIHAPHRGARLAGIEPGLPYIAWRESGSPAGRARLYAQRSILEVNGVPTPDLDALVEIVRELPDRQSVRVLVLTRQGEREVLTLETEQTFWPSQELRWDPEDGWSRQAL